MKENKIVITGTGMVSSLGFNTQDNWKNLCDGKCGIDKNKGFDTSELDTKIAAEVNADDVKNLIASKFGKRESKKMTKNTQMALLSAYEAIEESGINIVIKASAYT